LPALGRLEQISFTGDLGAGELELTASTPEDAAEIAKALPDWILGHSPISSVILSVREVGVDGNTVKIGLMVAQVPALAISTP
jgi:hypothetical protein